MKKLLIACACAAAVLGVSAQNAVTMPTEGTEHRLQKDYQAQNTGFYMAGEASGAYSLNGGKHVSFTELDATGGYRFSEYLRAGIGIGARYYFNAAEVRRHHGKWGMPLYVNLRGNFIPTEERNVVPFWSVDLGATFPDGVMVRPTVGIRVGQPRNAFVASIGYVGQSLKVCPEKLNGKQNKLYNFITIKVGYEF